MSKTFHPLIASIASWSVASLTALLLLATSNAAGQQDYPSRPIRMVIPYGPGTGIDAIGRVFAQKLGAELGQSVVVDNKAGAAGVIGAEYVTKASPDGYTLFFSAGSIFALNPLLMANLPYDPFKGFSPISMVYSQPLVVSISTKVPAKTLSEFVALARTKPEGITAGSLGAFHILSAEQLAAATNTKFLNVNYKAGALVALMSGEVDMMFDVISLMAPQHKGGKIRALAVASDKRMAILPDVPTLAESGYPGFEISTWTSLSGPPTLPKAIVDKINVAVVKVVNMPEMQELATNMGLRVYSSTPEQVNDMVRKEFDRFRKVAVTAGIKPQ
jgi:tripartite-type tricarboxylate transporter receptor subunit TctC